MERIKKNYDIIIIGGGLLGSATAYQLSKRGAKNILLLDKNEIASQSSSRAACLLTRARTKPILMEMVQETYNCIEEIEQLTGESLGLQHCGSITIASSEASMNSLEAIEQAAINFPIPNERINNDKLAELLPWINTDKVEAALYMPTDCFIDSALLCSGYANAAKQMGVEIHANVGVKEIISEDAQIKGITLDNGDTIHAPIVINAAGAWSNVLMKSLNVGLPFTPVRSHFWITDVDKDKFPKNHPFAVIPDARAFTRSDVGALMIGLRENECLSFDPSTLTDSLEDFDFERGATWKVLDECAPLLKDYLPSIDEIGIAHYVAGPSCYVPDTMYIIGAIDSHAGLYTISGCSGAGVAVGGGMGRLMAEIVLNEETYVDTRPFSPARFGTIDPFSADFQRRCAEARSNKKGG
jgi:glycine/D-amino acid oxidase-like deaminating enzyme